MTKPFQLVAGHPVLDLVNTLDWRFRSTGPEELLNTYDDLLRFAEQSGMLTPRQTQRIRRESGGSATQTLQSARELREAAAQILYAIMGDRTPPAAVTKKLDHHIRAAHTHRKLRWNQSRLELSWSGSESDPQFPIWLLAQSASDLLTTQAAEMIRACDNPECRWLFLDTSKNHSRRWCDMSLCGNRMKARRFKAQHKA
ncbi:CGNR zinc finger domain-containing protein [Edaphobacter bradus]|uniref:CGNR zinc finger domain-containing protein n=1 Tax=Edaphobacter bradus TaxID=2259016 RepID=UPI0021E05EE4|nr:ABATE domain-containing protein [Edaphobacter bradus]